MKERMEVSMERVVAYDWRAFSSTSNGPMAKSCGKTETTSESSGG
jgi:hypothetical protein